MKKTNQKGFTLIELIMVIVILGILSAFALPRFADFGESARVSSLEGGAGAARSASGIARSQFLVNGLTEDIDGNGNDGVTLDGQDVLMTDDGYPIADDGGIDIAAQLSSEFEKEAVTGTTREFRFEGRENCSFVYDESDGSVSDPTTSGCE